MNYEEQQVVVLATTAVIVALILAGLAVNQAIARIRRRSKGEVPTTEPGSLS